MYNLIQGPNGKCDLTCYYSTSSSYYLSKVSKINFCAKSQVSHLGRIFLSLRITKSLNDFGQFWRVGWFIVCLEQTEPLQCSLQSQENGPLQLDAYSTNNPYLSETQINYVVPIFIIILMQSLIATRSNHLFGKAWERK